MIKNNQGFLQLRMSEFYRMTYLRHKSGKLGIEDAPTPRRKQGSNELCIFFHTNHI